MSVNSRKVYLVGVGPGDPRLITRRAEQLIKQADVILYDRLVNPFIIQLANQSVELLNVGKTPYQKQIKQEAINKLLVQYGQTNKNIVRLKGGDPAIFGRVDEEIAVLEENHISYEIIPGITTASAAASYQSHGLTKRGTANQITFVTGHFQQGRAEQIKIDALLNGGTIAVYMGLKRLPNLIKEIQTQSKTNYDVAIISNVSLATQQTYKGKVSTIINDIEGINEQSPALILIGDIVNNTTTSWFENLPQFGKKILIKGTYEKAIEKAWQYYDEGAWSFVETEALDKSPTRITFEQDIIQNTTFDEIVEI